MFSNRARLVSVGLDGLCSAASGAARQPWNYIEGGCRSSRRVSLNNKPMTQPNQLGNALPHRRVKTRVQRMARETFALRIGLFA